MHNTHSMLYLDLKLQRLLYILNCSSVINLKATVLEILICIAIDHLFTIYDCYQIIAFTWHHSQRACLWELHVNTLLQTMTCK